MSEEKPIDCGTCVRSPTCYVVQNFVKWSGLTGDRLRAVRYEGDWGDKISVEAFEFFCQFATFCRYYKKSIDEEEVIWLK